MRLRVRKHLRRHATPRITKTASEQRRIVEQAIRRLHELREDADLKYVCRVEITDNDSQVVPDGHGFRRGACSVINVEHADAQDVPEAMTTIQHEARHARDIALRGEKGISKRREISAHRHTIGFLKRWKRDEHRKAWRRRIEQEKQEERESIAYLEAH